MVKAPLLVLRDLTLTRQAEGAIKLIVEGTSDDMGEDFFRSLVPRYWSCR